MLKPGIALLAVSGSVLLAASLAIAPAATAAAAGPGPDRPQIPLAQVVAGPGATTTLFAWPSNDVLKTMKVGDSFKLQPISSIRGTGSLGIDHVADLAPFAAKDGTVNLESRSSDGTVRGFPVHVSLDRANIPTSVVAIDGVAHGGPTQIRSGQATQSLSAPATESTPTPSADPATPKSCVSTLQRTDSHILTQVGQYYSQWTTLAQMTFSYTSGASSRLGIGVSASGAYGSFSASGTASVTAQAVQGFPTATQSQHLRSYFNYGYFRLDCVIGMPGTTYHSYEERPTSYAGGTNIINVGLPSVSSSYCVPEAAGSPFTKSTTAATTWSNGVSLGSTIGLDLSSETGYTAAADVHFLFTASGRLCGTNGDPGNNPGRLVALW